MINRMLPDFSSGLWERLMTEYADHTFVILIADILRWAGLPIRKQIFWERTTQDYLSQLFTSRLLESLHKFQNVVVRFGITGAVHNYHVGDQRRPHRL